MKCYALVIPDESRSLQTTARDRTGALANFSRALGHDITENDEKTVAPYLLDEWEYGHTHWVNATIPIWRKR